MSRHSSGTCVTLRPDASGALVPVATARQAGPAVRAGSFCCWDDQRQAEGVVGTLAECIAGIDAACDEEILYYGRGFPQPLNRAEQAHVTQAHADARETGE